MEREFARNKIISCKDIKNEHYAEILKEYEEGNNVLASPSGDKFLKTKKWGCIPLLAQHPISVRNGTIYLFSGNNRVQQITRGRFKQQGRKTNLRNSSKEVVGKKSNLILENHLQEGLIFRKHTMSLLSMEKPVLIHYSSETHSDFEVTLRDDDQETGGVKVTSLTEEVSSLHNPVNRLVSSNGRIGIQQEIDFAALSQHAINIALYSTPKQIFSITPESSSISGGVVIKINGSFFSPEAFVKLDGVIMKTAHVGNNELWFITPSKPSPQNSRITICDRNWFKEIDFFFTEDIEKMKMKSFEARIEKLEQQLSKRNDFTSSQASELSSKISSSDMRSLEERLLNAEMTSSRPIIFANNGKVSISDLTNPHPVRPTADNSFFPPHHLPFPSLQQMRIPPTPPLFNQNFFPRKRTTESIDDYASDVLTKLAKH